MCDETMHHQANQSDRRAQSQSTEVIPGRGGQRISRRIILSDLATARNKAHNQQIPLLRPGNHGRCGHLQ